MGLVQGTGAAQGFITHLGEQTLNLPGIGSIKVELFTKPREVGEIAKVQVDVSSYTMSTDKGGQATSDEKHAWYPKSFAGMQVGICAAQLFATLAGEHSFDVLGIGFT